MNTGQEDSTAKWLAGVPSAELLQAVLPLQPQPVQAPQAIEGEAQVCASTVSDQGTSVGQSGGASSSVPSTEEPLQVCACRTCVCEDSKRAVLVLHTGGSVAQWLGCLP